MTEKLFQRKLTRLASVQLCSSRFVRHFLEEKLAKECSHIKLLGLVEFHAYDETPLRTTVGDSHKMIAQVRASTAKPSIPSQLQLLHRLGTCMKQTGIVCKVLQDQQWFGMVLQKGSSFLKVVGEQVSPLQVLEHTTAETMAKALLLQSNSSRFSDAFEFKSLLTASDKAGYNMKGEKEFVRCRAGWSHLPLHCEIHDNSHVFSATVEPLCTDQITGILNTALSLRHSGSISAFRRALREEIQETLVIKQGSCNQEACLHRQRTLQVFTAGSSKTLSQLMLLSLLPNGDWRKSDVVEHYVDHAMPHDAYPAIASTMAAGLLVALVARKPGVWCRHRWTGCQVALEELGLLTAVHNLLPRAYKRFLCHLKVPKSLPVAASSSEHTLSTNQPHNMPMSLMGMLDHEAAGLDDATTHSAGLEPNKSNESGSTTMDWAAENESQRKKASQWLQKDPFPYLCLLAICIKPLQDLMHKQFQVCGDRWNQEQDALAAQKLLSGDVVGVLARQYQVTIAAAGVLESEFMQNLKNAFSNYDLWQCIPEANRDISMSHLAFAMLSRAGAMIESRVVHVHKTFPVKLFTLLLDPHKATELASTKPCLLDNFSAAVLEKYTGLESQECQQVLLLHASLAWTTTARVESLHSTIRRQLVLRSVQTHPLPLEVLSAEYLLQQMRTSSAEVQKFCSNALATTKVVAKVWHLMHLLHFSSGHSNKWGMLLFDVVRSFRQIVILGIWI
eukprot:5197117-Amphidinium_carterae.3